MDIESMIIDYIKPGLLILVPVLWYIGTQLKATKQIQDWVIPFVLMLISIVLAVTYVLSFEGISATGLWVGIVQGLVIAMAEGQLYQYYKQITDKRQVDK
jgi:uncharacterized membrane protein YagU involved in acid resistance